MSKFSAILILVYRNFLLLIQFYMKLFLIVMVSLLYKNLILYPYLGLYDRKHFCSVLTELRNLSFDIHKKISVLKSLFNTVRGLKACNFNKKDTSTQLFSCEYHKIFTNYIFMEHLRWLLLNMVEEFLRISNSS